MFYISRRLRVLLNIFFYYTYFFLLSSPSHRGVWVYFSLTGIFLKWYRSISVSVPFKWLEVLFNIWLVFRYHLELNFSVGFETNQLLIVCMFVIKSCSITSITCAEKLVDQFWSRNFSLYNILPGSGALGFSGRQYSLNLCEIYIVSCIKLWSERIMGIILTLCMSTALFVMQTSRNPALAFLGGTIFIT